MNIDEKIFKNDSKDIVDRMFDLKMFKENITRDDMSGFEDLIQFLLESKYNTYIKCSEFMEKITKKK